MKTYEAVIAQAHVFLTSALVGGEWSASRPGRFAPPPPKSPRYPLGMSWDGEEETVDYTGARILSPR
jgi:hypothetical protein